MLKLVYFVPDSAVEQTKQAIFAAGAGGVGNYQYCSWQVFGQGQFMPIAEAKPYLGQLNQIERVDEWRVEVIVPESHAKAVKEALLGSHPYEEVAYEFYQILEID